MTNKLFISKKKIISAILAGCIATQSCAALSLSMPQWLKWENIKLASQGLKDKAFEAKNDPKKFCKENQKAVAGLAVGALGTLAAAATCAYKFFAKTAKNVNLPTSIPTFVPALTNMAPALTKTAPALTKIAPNLISTAKSTVTSSSIKAIAKDILRENRIMIAVAIIANVFFIACVIDVYFKTGLTRQCKTPDRID